MSQFQSNLSSNWNKYLTVLLMIGLAILKNQEYISADDVVNIQYALVALGILPGSKAQTVVRRSRKALPLLFIFFLFQCKPAPKPTHGDVARVQVKEQITRTYEKVVVAVDAMPDAELSKLVASDSETVKLFRQYYRENERAQ